MAISHSWFLTRTCNEEVVDTKKSERNIKIHLDNNRLRYRLEPTQTRRAGTSLISLSLALGWLRNGAKAKPGILKFAIEPSEPWIMIELWMGFLHFITLLAWWRAYVLFVTSLVRYSNVSLQAQAQAGSSSTLNEPTSILESFKVIIITLWWTKHFQFKQNTSHFFIGSWFSLWPRMPLIFHSFLRGQLWCKKPLYLTYSSIRMVTLHFSQDALGQNLVCWD